MTARRRVPFGVLVLVASILPAAAMARGPALDDGAVPDVVSYLEEQRDELGWPGLAAGIVLNGEPILLDGFGVAGAHGAGVDEDTIFLVASLSKSITAVAVMQLVDAGLVDIDDPVTDYLPALAPGGEDVSVADFMFQFTGLDTYAGVEAFTAPFGENLSDNVSRLEPELASGSPHQYSNANYDALALMVEMVSGELFADYVDENIFTPLGMDRSFVGPATGNESNLATGHYHSVLTGYHAHRPWMQSGMVGSYLMWSTAADIVKLMQAHLTDGGGIVSPESLTILHEGRPYDSSTNLRYGGGLRIEPPGTAGQPAPYDEMTTWWHDGSSPSYRAVMQMTPEADLGIVLLTSGNDLTNEAALLYVAQNTKLLMAGLQPFDFNNSSGLLIQWGKHLMLALIAVQGTLGLLTVRAWRRQRPARRLVAAATVVDIFALFVVFYLVPATGDSPLSLVTSLPDYRLLIGAMLLGVAWGVVRTFLIMSRHRPREA